jgi:hypothetical protein
MHEKELTIDQEVEGFARRIKNAKSITELVAIKTELEKASKNGCATAFVTLEGYAIERIRAHVEAVVEKINTETGE